MTRAHNHLAHAYNQLQLLGAKLSGKANTRTEKMRAHYDEDAPVAARVKKRKACVRAHAAGVHEEHKGANMPRAHHEEP